MDLVLFGTGPVARMAHFLFSADSPHRVVAFTVDRAHLEEDRFLGLPLVAFEDVRRSYPPERFAMFVAVGYRRMNAFRQERFEQARAMGYELPSYVSSRASVWPELRIGANCLVMDLVVIHPFTRIGDDNILWSGCHIGHDSVVEDHCFIASHAVVSGFATVGSHCFLGTNSTVRDGIRLARGTVVGAGAVIGRDTREGGVYAAPGASLLPIPSDRLPNL